MFTKQHESLPTIQPQTDPPATPRLPKLAEAAEYLRGGWRRDDFYDGDRYCAVGSVMQAVGIDPDNFGVRDLLMMDFDPNIQRLAASLDIDPGSARTGPGTRLRNEPFVYRMIGRAVIWFITSSPTWKVMYWNDMQAKNQQEVVDTVERAAYDI